MTRAAIALGSNLGDRAANLREAVAELRCRVGIVGVSKLYDTAPMYVEDQPTFLNGAIMVETEMGPLELLKLLKTIERQVGRKLSPRFGPREIDLDLISYGVAKYRFSELGRPVLVLPHPRAIERRFVLQPLADIDPTMHLPGLGSVSDLLPSTNEQAPNVHEVSDALLPVFSR